MSIKDITIVITSFKSTETIKNCLNSIDKQCKVIVVENSKDSEFKKNIENQFENVECILTGDNLGYGKANNIGLKRVITKFALILNPDTILDPSSLNNFLLASKQIPDFAIMGPYIQENRDINKSVNSNNLKPIITDNVKGFAMFLNLSKFKDVGFFDENIFFYFEEIDLCKRLIKSGKKIYLVPSIKIKHDGARSHDSYINEEMELSRNWHWMWSTFYYHKKYKGFFVSYIIIFPKLFSAIVKVLLYSLLFNKKKKLIYYQRLSGLTNSIFGRTSWYRPKV
jgi:N-acetylglucosaminyl-diphospho-decaprenol L-rhamnosyltransferase